MTINIKRVDLYEEIWSHGVSKTAEKYNTTVVKLKSAIVDNDIPIPDRSYWANIHMGKEVKKQNLPDPSNNVEINIEGKRTRVNLKDIKHTLSDDIRVQKRDVKNIFSDIELNDPDSVNDALMNIKIPKNMPSKPEPLISPVISELREEKNDGINSYYFGNNVGKSSYSKVLRFHRRDEIEIGKDSLLLTNVLFKALNTAGAKISLNNEADAEISIDGGEILLKCHIPSKKVMLKTTDKRWSEYRDTTFEPIDEKIRFSVGIKSVWTEPSPIKQRTSESNEEYLKRVFVKIISLIPKSRERNEEIKLQQIEFEKEEKLKELHKEKHDNDYDKVKKLINDTFAYEVASKIREYIKNSNIQNIDEKSWAYSQADWIENGNNSSTLDESDRQKLIDYFLKEKSDSNNNFLY